MITPIKSLNIWDLMKRENDLLVSIDDIKAMEKNERENVIYKILTHTKTIVDEDGIIHEVVLVKDIKRIKEKQNGIHSV